MRHSVVPFRVMQRAVPNSRRLAPRLPFCGLRPYALSVTWKSTAKRFVETACSRLHSGHDVVAITPRRKPTSPASASCGVASGGHQGAAMFGNSPVHRFVDFDPAQEQMQVMLPGETDAAMHL